MGAKFNKLSQAEQAAVQAYVRAEYDKLVFQQPNGYVAQNAQAAPDAWEERLRESIASDPHLLQAILEGGTTSQRGFTLIELAIVLVVIGVLAGAVLVGQDLIEAARVSGTISQIQKYQTATNTFREKYGYLPGDIPDPYATQFGFVARGSQPGEGDGNGVIEGNAWVAGQSNYGLWECRGETVVFWRDLSTAHLIDGGFHTADEINCSGDLTLTSTPGVNDYFPQAKLGRGNYIYVWSGGWGMGNGIDDEMNYFGLSAIQGVGGGGLDSIQALTVREAYGIDTKMDDGMPQSGRVTAMYVFDDGDQVNWASGNSYTDDGASGVDNVPTTAATPYAATNCYDNNDVTGPQTYSIAQNSSALNCALSFQFQ